MRVRGKLKLFGVAVVALAAGAASANEPGYRLPPITIKSVQQKAPRLATPTATTRQLSLRDRYMLSDIRTRGTELDLGPFAVTVSGSRLRSASGKDGSGLRSADRVSVFAAGFDAGLDVVEGLTLHAFSSVMRAKRRFDLLPGSARSLKSEMTALGVGIEQSALGSFVLDYTDSTARGRRDAMSRVTEQVGGAAPFGKGMRVSLSNATPSDERGRLTWTLSAASISRPMYRNDFAAVAQTLADHRAEMAFRIAL